MMGGSGMSQHMINSLRNNSIRKDRTHFDKKSIYLKKLKNKRKLVFKKATKEQLDIIRTRLQKRNVIYRRKVIVYSSIITISILSIFLFMINQYY